MRKDDELRLLKELAGILGKQIELVRRDDIAGLEDLIGHSGQLAGKLAAAGLLDRPQYDDWRKRLTGLYKNLELVLSAQKEAVSGQLRSINMGKKVRAAYRGNFAR